MLLRGARAGEGEKGGRAIGEGGDEGGGRRYTGREGGREGNGEEWLLEKGGTSGGKRRETETNGKKSMGEKAGGNKDYRTRKWVKVEKRKVGKNGARHEENIFLKSEEK